VRTAAGAHTDYANALYAYVAEQETAKTRAQSLAQEALAARQAHQAALNQVGQYSTAPSGESQSARDSRKQNQRDAQARADSAQSDFDGVVRRARALQSHMDGVAGQAARKIDAAAERAPYAPPGWLEQAWDGITSAAAATWHFVTSPEFLHTLSTALNIVSAVCAFIPGLQGVALVAAGLAIVTDVLARVASGQPINWMDVGFDAAMLLIPGGRVARLFRGIPAPFREAAMGAVLGGATAGARDLIDGRGFRIADIAEGAAFGAGVAVVGGRLSQRLQSSMTSEELTQVFRVEGSGNRRINIDEAGNISVRGNGMLFLNFGDEQRAASFLDRRLTQGFSDTVVKTFDVPTSYVDQLRSVAVPEDMARLFPESPLVVDVNQAADQFGLRSNHFPDLLDNVVPGSGRILP
jgi:hypothetical protein